MTPDLRLRAKTLDQTVIGSRLREARLRAGLTQGQVAGPDASTAYISRIESGSRRPSIELLVGIAERLGIQVEDILAPEAETPIYLEQVAAVQLQLDYADLALRTGQLDQALTGADAVIASSDTPVSMRRQARHLRALALEASGDIGEAITELEELAQDRGDALLWIRVLLALSRCHKVAGDLARAADIGDWAAPIIAELGLSGSDEAVQLSVTVASAHFFRGDVDHAVRLCVRALETADESGSPLAQASAYWNSSVFESGRGNVASALGLAERAVSLFERSDDARNLARLRTEVGLMQLKLVPPQVEPALANLERSDRELVWTSGSNLDRARNQLGHAQAMLARGERAAGRGHLERCLELAGDQAPIVVGAAHVLLARLAWDDDDRATAAAETDAAGVCADIAEQAGHGRTAAQLWFDIATLAEEHADLTAAVTAFRRAGNSSGLHGAAYTPQSASSRR